MHVQHFTIRSYDIDLNETCLSVINPTLPTAFYVFVIAKIPVANSDCCFVMNIQNSQRYACTTSKTILKLIVQISFNNK